MSAPITRSLLALRDRGVGLAVRSEQVVALAERPGFAGGPVASLSASAGLAARSDSFGGRVVVLSRDGSETAFAADEILGVFRVEARDVLAMPELVRRTRPSLEALAMVDGRPFVVVDAEALAPVGGVEGGQ